MSQAFAPTMTPVKSEQAVGGKVVLRIPPAWQFTDDEFFDLCQANRELRLERAATGEITIMSPTGGATGNRSGEVTRQVGNWTVNDDTGAFFDSSTGFKLPNQADRSPDAAWVHLERLAQLTAEQKGKFLPLCPDFAAELMSPSDTLEEAQAKMAEYLANGAKLGWLLDPKTRTVYVYRPGIPVEKLENVMEISGDPELPGFVLQLARVWEPRI